MAILLFINPSGALKNNVRQKSLQRKCFQFIAMEQYSAALPAERARLQVQAFKAQRTECVSCTPGSGCPGD